MTTIHTLPCYEKGTPFIYIKANSYNPGFDDTPRPIGQPSVLASGPIIPDRTAFTRSINTADRHAYVHGYSRKTHHDMRKGKHHYYDGRPGGGSYFNSYYLDPYIYADSYVYSNPTQYNYLYPEQYKDACQRQVIVRSKSTSQNSSSENSKNKYMKKDNMSDASYYNLVGLLCIILTIFFLYAVLRR